MTDTIFIKWLCDKAGWEVMYGKMKVAEDRSINWGDENFAHVDWKYFVYPLLLRLAAEACGIHVSDDSISDKTPPVLVLPRR